MKMLGKQPRRDDARTLKLSKYLGPCFPTPPEACDWTQGVTKWGMLLNNSLGCCTISDGPGHATQLWTLNATGTMVTPPDSLILSTYEQWCGYNPQDPNSDQGGVEIDVLKHWQNQGFSGDNFSTTLDAFAAIHQIREGDVLQFDWQMVKASIWLFGCAYLGVQLPLRAGDQDVWDVVPGTNPIDVPGSWGGHAILLVAYDNQGLTCITWGGLQRMTWRWFATYCDEAYALISREWIRQNSGAPSGFDLVTLEVDLVIVKG